MLFIEGLHISLHRLFKHFFQVTNGIIYSSLFNSGTEPFLVIQWLSWYQGALNLLAVGSPDLIGSYILMKASVTFIALSIDIIGRVSVCLDLVEFSKLVVHGGNCGSLDGTDPYIVP